MRAHPEREVELIERAAELFVTGVVRRRHEVEMLGEAAPDFLVQRFRPAVIRDRRTQLLAILLVAQGLSRRADDRERRGEQALQSEVVERGDELALRQIARAAEDDDRRGLGDT
jgi:hypothetical protein